MTDEISVVDFDGDEAVAEAVVGLDEASHTRFGLLKAGAGVLGAVMVRGEVEIARRQAASGTGPRILPVRVAFDGALPYPLNAYLDGIQYAVWNDVNDTSRLLGELLADRRVDLP